MLFRSSSGRGFFAAFKRKGLRDNAMVLAMLIFAAILAAAAHFVLSLSAAVTAGLYAGSMTNTPALAAVLEQIKGFAPPGQVDQLLAEPVIGYSVTYPMGVVKREDSHRFFNYSVMKPFYVPSFAFIDKNGIMRARFVGGIQPSAGSTELLHRKVSTERCFCLRTGILVDHLRELCFKAFGGSTRS